MELDLGSPESCAV